MKLSPTAAIHEHDCPNCIHLGVVVESNVDLYICKSRYETTILARHSSNGPDYYAWEVGLNWSNQLYHLALDEAKLRGLL